MEAVLLCVPGPRVVLMPYSSSLIFKRDFGLTFHRAYLKPCLPLMGSLIQDFPTRSILKLMGSNARYSSSFVFISRHIYWLQKKLMDAFEIGVCVEGGMFFLLILKMSVIK